MIQTYNVGDLRRMLSEESREKNEFKPVIYGDDETKKINDKAYADIKKETEKYDGGLTANKGKNFGGGIKDSANKGMHDLRFDSITQPYIDRIKSQMKGYTSADAEKEHKNDAFGNAVFDNDGNTYKAAKEHAENEKKNKDKASEIGLTGRELSKNEIEKQDTTMYESKNKIKRLTFKNTEFISEGHVLSRVPDEYKKSGNKFVMRDAKKNEYLVEWSAIDPKVTKQINESAVNETKERMKMLWGYKSAAAHTSTPNERLQEGKSFEELVNKVRVLNKERRLL